jgi:aminoglycoside phosphotransferase (APT) family kinase protein
MTQDPQIIAALEQSFAPALRQYFSKDGAVADLRAMEDGHAGLTFGFSLTDGADTTREFILKKAPEGVIRSGSTDIFRQARLLRALSRAGFPAPDAPWAEDGDAVLGAPFIVMERLKGRSVIVWDPSPEVMAQFHHPAAMWTETARLMGRLHAFDWRRELCDWEAPTNLDRELERWTKLLRHMEDLESANEAHRLSTALVATLPHHPRIGLVHGDLQPGNVLFERGAAQGLIDWDLAAIGPIGMDVGWLLMVADPTGWADAWRPVGAPGRDDILGAYHSAGGVTPAEVDWFQAFSHLRMAAITGLNLKLHRNGKRPDRIWERFALSVPSMLARGLALAQNSKEGALS